MDTMQTVTGEIPAPEKLIVPMTPKVVGFETMSEQDQIRAIGNLYAFFVDLATQALLYAVSREWDLVEQVKIEQRSTLHEMHGLLSVFEQLHSTP